MSWQHYARPDALARHFWIDRSTTGFVALAIAWGVAVSTGLILLWNYENRPGQPATPPQRWPAESQIARTPGLPTLVMLAHPNCPCSRASLEELDHLLARAGEAVSAYVLFVKPAGVPEDWEQTDLWRTATAIPGVRALRDDNGVEAARFHAVTSGQVILYDAPGALVFSGGITSARGHSGDNVGRNTILSWLIRGDADENSTPVFGCSLRDNDAAGALHDP